MDTKELEIVLKNWHVYDAIGKGARTVQDVRNLLKQEYQRDGGNLQRDIDHLRKKETPYLPFLSVEGEEEVVVKDEQGMREALEVLARLFQVGSIDVMMEDTEPEEVLRLEAMLSEAKSLEGSLRQKVVEQEKVIHKLQKQIEENKSEILKLQVDQKVIVESSIKVGPLEHPEDDLFFSDSHALIDVDKCVARFGGELDSFYREIPTDTPKEAPLTEEKMGEVGHELNEDNYFNYIIKPFRKLAFWEKRKSDMEKVKEFEKETGVQLFPGHYDKLDEVQRKRREVLKNRYLSLNDIIQNMHLTNQQKLMMYAMNGEYHNTYIERLINFAGHHCLNAEFVIYMLENPDVCTTYENTVDFLNEYANPSEARMKLDLARELIEGKWYVMGKYKGRETKFQLVPIDEINELRQKVGLPISKFTYDKKAPEEPKIPKEEEPMHTPEFVEHATEGGSNVIFEDDGFENAADHIEEAHEYDDA